MVAYLSLKINNTSVELFPCHATVNKMEICKCSLTYKNSFIGTVEVDQGTRFI